MVTFFLAPIPFKQSLIHLDIYIQVPSKLRTNSVPMITFDAKKSKETLMTRFSGNTIIITETTIFVRLENLLVENPL